MGVLMGSAMFGLGVVIAVAAAFRFAPAREIRTEVTAESLDAHGIEGAAAGGEYGMIRGVALAPLLAIAVVIGQAGVLADEGAGEKLLGRPAPKLAVSHWTNSEPLTLAELRGKVVLLRWWTAPGCPFCAATAPSLNSLHERYADRGLVIIGLYHHKSTAPLDPAQVERYGESFGFRFPLAIDDGWENLGRWWLDASERGWTSVSFLLDREGIVRWVHPGGEYPPDSEDYAELEATVKGLLDEGEARSRP